MTIFNVCLIVSVYFKDHIKFSYKKKTLHASRATFKEEFILHSSADHNLDYKSFLYFHAVPYFPTVLSL